MCILFLGAAVILITTYVVLYNPGARNGHCSTKVNQLTSYIFIKLFYLFLGSEMPLPLLLQFLGKYIKWIFTYGFES